MQASTVITLIIAAALVVAAVHGATKIFGKNASDATRDAMVVELRDLAGESRKFFVRPALMGGGGRSFANIGKMKRVNSKSRAKNDPQGQPKGKQGGLGTQIWETEVGTYYVVSAAQDSAVIQGTADAIGLDGKNPVSVQLVVKQRSEYIKTIN